MGYAEVAASTLATGFAANDLSFRYYRRRLLLSPVGRYLMLRYLLAQGCYTHYGSDAFVRALWQIVDALTRIMGELPPIADVLPAQDSPQNPTGQPSY